MSELMHIVERDCAQHQHLNLHATVVKHGRFNTSI